MLKGHSCKFQTWWKVFSENNCKNKFLPTEIYKLAKDLSKNNAEIFRFHNSRRYDLRYQNTFEIPFRNSLYNGTESISYLGPKMWELVLHNLNHFSSFGNFKEQLTNGTQRIAHIEMQNLHLICCFHKLPSRQLLAQS